MTHQAPIGAPRLGVRLREAAPLIAAIKRLLVEDFTLHHPERALPRPGRVTVYLCNHGPLLTPWPAPVLTADYLLAQGDFDDLISVTLFHRVVELVPGLSPVLRRYFGHSTPALRSVDGITSLMRERRFDIVGTAPEGSSCVYSYDAPLGPFTRFGLIKAALDADADIVLTAQAGLERFGRPLRLPWGLALPLTGSPRGLLLPVYTPGRRARVTLRYRRYVPLLGPEERARLDPAVRHRSYQAEFEHLHRQLGEVLREDR